MLTAPAKHLLLVEPNQTCATRIERALAELGTAAQVIHARSREAALAYLATKPIPPALLALVDMDAPDLGGRDLVCTMKNDETWRSIPIIVMTASDKSLDVLESFSHSIAGYLIKPRDGKEMVKAIRVVTRYWSLSRMPSFA